MKKMIAGLLFFVAVNAFAQGLLPSWNEGPSKQALISFIEKTTTQGSADYIPVPERIAVFDNDGTLWSEQPIYVQIAFVFDRIKGRVTNERVWLSQGEVKREWLTTCQDIHLVTTRTHFCRLIVIRNG